MFTEHQLLPYEASELIKGIKNDGTMERIGFKTNKLKNGKQINPKKNLVNTF